ncbi:Exportin-T [Trichinella pseudospiralis]
MRRGRWNKKRKKKKKKQASSELQHCTAVREDGRDADVEVKSKETTTGSQWINIFLIISITEMKNNSAGSRLEYAKHPF